ncbi:MAG: hypothetical protein ACK4IK_09710 [Bacteroidia bacterium]
MKTTNKYLSILSIVFSFIIISCEKDDTPSNNPTGTVNDVRDRYTGTWTASESSQIYGQTSYQVNIKKAPNDNNQVLIENFYNLGFTNAVYAILANNNTVLQINQQSVSGQTISGSLTIYSTNDIRGTFNANDGSGVDNVSVNFTR